MLSPPPLLKNPRYAIVTARRTTILFVIVLSTYY